MFHTRFVLPLLLPTALLFGSCYSGWDELEFVEPCDPLIPAVECGQHNRCLPKAQGDPECDGPASEHSRQDAFCVSNEACGTTEVCALMDEYVRSKICMQLCRNDDECPSDYTCKLSPDMQVREERWGVCLKIAPPDWHCDTGLYAGAAGADARCNCGCGAYDPDCVDNSDESCEACEPEAKARCVPEKWKEACSISVYNDGVCDCGCGIPDHGNDCDDIRRDSCERCPSGSCGAGICTGSFDAIDLNDNSQCKEVPPNWKCSDEAYQDGRYCHCGCGVKDPDCEGTKSSFCDSVCDEASCGYDANCDPTVFQDNDNAVCEP